MLKVRVAVEEVGWHAREAALTVEEGVVWRGADAARELAERAGDSWFGHSAARVRRLVERRVAWPLADGLRDSGELARTSIATAAVVAALVAGAGGAMLAADGEGTGPAPAVAGPAVAVPVAVADGTSSRTLEGVTPNFASSPRAASEAGPEPATPARPVPSEPAARAAWRFTQAFVLYEVGRASEAADELERLATPALARSLADSPPRLPAEANVPKARVLNVVLGKGRGRRVDASVSLVRLQAVSELRLTLRRSDGGWRVAAVLG